MFSKVATLITLTLAALAVAAPGGHSGDHTDYSTDCNTGSVQCCGQLHAPTSADGTALLALVGASVDTVSGQVGAQCNPISVFFGAGTAGNCAGTTTCCKDYHKASLVGVSCTPLTGQA